MTRRRFLPVTLIAAAGLLALTMLIGGRATAQQSYGTPASGSPAAGEETPHPAHIHNGTCAALGDVVYPLNDVAAVGAMGTPMAGMEMASPEATMASGAGVSGTPMADKDVVAQSTTTVQVALADISAGGFAINVHESMDQIQNYIACGDITGTPANNMLQIPLNELNSSGYYGTATLTDNGDGTTTVVIELEKTEGKATPTS
jgi:hypothetical protein